MTKRQEEADLSGEGDIDWAAQAFWVAMALLQWCCSHVHLCHQAPISLLMKPAAVNNKNKWQSLF